MPPQGDISAIDVFVEVVLRDLKKLHTHPQSNCTSQELQALTALERDDSIVVKPSDEGGHTVILAHNI